MTQENRRKKGNHYEQIAAEYLSSCGITILAQNYHNRRFGEIDIIGQEEGYLVFIEVKYRKDTQMGDPREAVDFHKQQQIRQTAQAYLYRHGYGEYTPCRFDVVSILGKDICWLKNAF